MTLHYDITSYSLNDVTYIETGCLQTALLYEYCRVSSGIPGQKNRNFKCEKIREK